MLCLAINKMNCKCNWLEIFQHAKWVVIVQCQTLWISIEETFSCMYSNGRRLNQSKQLFNFTMLRCNLPAVWSIQLMHHHFQIFFRKNSFKNQLQVMRHCWTNNTDLSLFAHTHTYIVIRFHNAKFVPGTVWQHPQHQNEVRKDFLSLQILWIFIKLF